MSCDSQCSVALPRGAAGSLRCVIVVFPDYTHLLFSPLKLLCWVHSMIIYNHIFIANRADPDQAALTRDVRAAWSGSFLFAKVLKIYGIWSF